MSTVKRSVGRPRLASFQHFIHAECVKYDLTNPDLFQRSALLVARDVGLRSRRRIEQLRKILTYEVLMTLARSDLKNRAERALRVKRRSIEAMGFEELRKWVRQNWTKDAERLLETRPGAYLSVSNPLIRMAHDAGGQAVWSGPKLFTDPDTFTKFIWENRASLALPVTDRSEPNLK